MTMNIRTHFGCSMMLPCSSYDKGLDPTSTPKRNQLVMICSHNYFVWFRNTLQQTTQRTVHIEHVDRLFGYQVWNNSPTQSSCHDLKFRFRFRIQKFRLQTSASAIPSAAHRISSAIRSASWIKTWQLPKASSLWPMASYFPLPKLTRYGNIENWLAWWWVHASS